MRNDLCSRAKTPLASPLDVPDSLWSVEQQLHGVSDRVLVAVAAPEYA